MARILFIAPNRIGDAVLATAALEHALSLYPGAQVTIASGPLPSPLYRATPGLEALHTVSKTRSRTGGHWLALRKALAGTGRFDLAVDLRGTLLTYTLPVGRRIVHRKSAVLRHKLEELASLMRSRQPLTPRLRLDEQALQEAAARLGPEAGPILALGPGSNFVGKQWPPERFAAAARRLASGSSPLSGARVVLLGAPEDRAANREIAESLVNDGVPVVDLTAGIDLLACTAVLSRATLFIGNDSGLMHMAAVSGIATLGLFGPSNEKVYGPAGPRARAVRGRAYEEIMEGKYMPSIKYSLMTDLGVDAVEQAALSLLTAGGLNAAGGAP
jgi:lipopolysaccharide export system permease protein